MNRKAGAALAWLPVLGLVALLFGIPGGSSGAGVASLTVTPGSGQYGGTTAHWVVDGLPAGQRARLQRTSNPTAGWADVEGASNVGTTNARGHLEFDYPTPAMNSVYFRVATSGGVSEAHHFLSKHQDAQIAVQEVAPAERLLPNGQKLGIPGVGWAIADEPFVWKVDTAQTTDPNLRRPILAGRAVTLQKRTVRGTDVIWTEVARGVIGRDGFVSLPEFNGAGDPALASGDYRVRLERWTQGGDDIGWFPSFPFDLHVVTRPLPVAALSATAPSDTKVNLTWRLPSDARRDKVVITRNVNGPADLNDLQVASLPATATTFSDTSVFQTSSLSYTYHYAVYTLSADGVYTRTPTRTSITPPAPPARGGAG